MKDPFDEQQEPAVTEEPAPLVDEALAATDRNGTDAAEQALRREISHLQEALAETVSEDAYRTSKTILGKIRSQPVTAAIAVALLAFVYGMTR